MILLWPPFPCMHVLTWTQRYMHVNTYIYTFTRYMQECTRENIAQKLNTKYKMKWNNISELNNSVSW